MKAAKRYSHGLVFTAAYTFSKTLDSYEGAGNLFNGSTFKSLASDSLPHMLTISIDYVVEPYGFIRNNTVARTLLAGRRPGVEQQPRDVSAGLQHTPIP